MKTKHADHAFTGEGARLHGGRWNTEGSAVIYTSATISLAVLELLVHLESAALLSKYQLYSVEFEEKLVTIVDSRSLPKNWEVYPPPQSAQQIGNQWVSARTSAVLKVPSAIVPVEYHYLLNHEHPDFPQIRISRPRTFPIDPRLLHDKRSY
ncbi:MAG: RES family NAD+ phosphorylase [Acidobacteriota bacterium]